MNYENEQSIDPMVAFYAAVTAVENGKVGEVELEFRYATSDHEIVMTMSVRREARQYISISPAEEKEE